ncbi:MAG: AraC family transcriptional regulator [Bacteroidales bacterium]|jgi:AraC-like DNA-binding protein|nr:AraC family transcriptional regulator [Bacteroidales bacterium]
MNEVKTVRYSDIFLSCCSDDTQNCTLNAKEHCLGYILSGEMEINERGKITKFHKGECAFVRKDNQVSITHQPKKGERAESIILRFPRKFLREFYRTIDKTQLPEDAKREKVSVYKLSANRPDIQSLFESMTPYFDSDVQPSDEVLKLKMMEGIYLLLDTDKSFYSSLFDFTVPWKIDILDFMNENYMYDLSLEEIASYTGRSLTAFKRDFGKISPLPPEKWVIEKRLKVAHDKINKENKKASDVYLEVGFKSLSHFSTAFKRQYGFPPTAM